VHLAVVFAFGGDVVADHELVGVGSVEFVEEWGGLAVLEHVSGGVRDEELSSDFINLVL
jgi:hypothetical protein